MNNEFPDNPKAERFREACYIFNITSLDGVANEYAQYLHKQGVDKLSQVPVRMIAQRLVRTGLSKFAPNIADMTVEQVKADTGHGAKKIHLKTYEQSVYNITLSDGLDIIEGLLQLKRDMARQEMGELGALPPSHDFPITLPHSSEQDALVLMII